MLKVTSLLFSLLLAQQLVASPIRAARQLAPRQESPLSSSSSSSSSSARHPVVMDFTVQRVSKKNHQLIDTQLQQKVPINTTTSSGGGNGNGKATDQVVAKSVVNRQKLNLPVEMSLQNNYALYSATLCFSGDSETCQPVQLQIDTGSSDLWVPLTNATDSNEATNEKYGSYNISQSQTFHNLSRANSNSNDYKFSIRYGDATEASGYLITDNVSLGSDITLSNSTFALATTNTAGQGVCGIGYPANEASNFKYDNLPILLKKQGYISKASYSLYLNSADASSGQLLFGAIDHSKYFGNQLRELDILKLDSSGQLAAEHTALFVPLSSISYGGGQAVSNVSSGNGTYSQVRGKGAGKTITEAGKSYNALLDTGTTLITVPLAIYTSFVEHFGTYDEAISGYATPCNTTGDPFIFTFGGDSSNSSSNSSSSSSASNSTRNPISITVPFSDLLFKVSMSDGSYYEKNGVPQCLFAVGENSKDFIILGDVFLRSVYAFVDLEENKVSLAQVRYSNLTNLEYV